ncbi:hypothetical protein MKX01_001907 [Papaver californicum]|nr:hypothetical protein MKX01_001907 [Papaver californicum]
MGARPIKLECLYEGEAWHLFHQMVFGAYDPCSSRRSSTTHDESDPVIRGLAKDIAKECLGLPLALLAIGRSMASKKKLKQWKFALSTLRESARRFSDMEDEVLRILKFSYDNLENSKLKSCFLYCSLYPEDYPIKIEELIDIWIGEGFLDEVPDIEKARLEGHDVIECFKSGCLLESCVIEEFGAKEYGVKMYDVIQINLKDSIKEQFNLDKLEFSERISLIGSKAVLKLIERQNAKIQTLSDEFFQYIPRIKVLSMTHHNLEINKLPTSSLGITVETGFSLKKLVTSVKLQLCTKKLLIYFGRDITSISSSPSSPLSPTSVSLAGMANLKLLHIRLCGELEELRIPSTSRVCADDKATLCTYMEVLHVQLVLELNIVCDMLQQSLCLVNLKHVRIMGCHKLKDVSWLIYAQNLETLYLGCQSRLEEIISDRFPGLTDYNITFPRLQTLKLEELKNLQRISNHNVKFTVLKDIRVMDCPGLKKLPFDSETLRRIEGENE